MALSVARSVSARPTVLHAGPFPVVHRGLAPLIEAVATLLPQAVTVAALDAHMRADCDIDILLLEIVFGRRLVVSRLAGYLARRPDLSIIVLTSDDEPSRCRQCLDQGAVGFISKRSAHEELPAALAAVMAGQTFVSSGLLPLCNTRGSHGSPLGVQAQIVLRELRRGRTHAEIAEQLGISTKGVEYHVAVLKRTLNIAAGRTDWGAV